MSGVTFSMNDMMIYQLVNMALSIIVLGAIGYGYILFVKAARRVIRVSDLIIQEKESLKNHQELQ